MGLEMDKQHSPNHNSYALYYNIVFVTRKRELLINAEIAGFLNQFFVNKSKEMEVHLLEQAFLCDHVHLILSLRPAHYIPEIINYLKGVSSHEANHHHDFANNLYWMRGYRLETISYSNLDSAKSYVRNQHKHHPFKIPE